MSEKTQIDFGNVKIEKMSDGSLMVFVTQNEHMNAGVIRKTRYHEYTPDEDNIENLIEFLKESDNV